MRCIMLNALNKMGWDLGDALALQHVRKSLVPKSRKMATGYQSRPRGPILPCLLLLFSGLNIMSKCPDEKSSHDLFYGTTIEPVDILVK